MVFSTRVFTRLYHLTSLILNSLIIFFILYKVLYNLKQAPHTCFSRLSFKLLFLGLIGSMNDLSLFILKSTYINLFVLIYMDGILVYIFFISKPLSPNFTLKNTLKDLGRLSFFIGMESQTLSMVSFQINVTTLLAFFIKLICTMPNWSHPITSFIKLS